jgi:hypothetical protein
MPRIFRYKLAHRLVFAAVVGGAMLMANAGAALASYGPPPPPVAYPGGYYCVVTSQTVGVAGRVIGPLGLGDLLATLDIRPGTFADLVQVTVTQPYGPDTACPSSADIGDAGFRGYHVVGGIGVLVARGGSTFAGRFRRAVTVHLSSSAITASSLVVAWDGDRFAKVPATVRRGSATFDLRHASDVAVLTPNHHR